MKRARFSCAALALALGLLAPKLAHSEPVPDPQAAAAEVRARLERDEWREALHLARDTAERFPDHPAARGALGAALFRAGRLAECEAVLGEHAVDAHGEISLARLRAAQGKGSEAAAAIERALAAAPADRDVLYWAGDLSPEREAARERLARYLDLSAGDDPRRIEAARQALTWFEELGDRRVWVSESAPDEAAVPLHPVWEPGGRIVGYAVDLFLGAEPKAVRVLLDTGTHGLVLVERQLKRRGFEPLADKTRFGGGGSGRVSGRRGIVGRIALGPLVWRDAVATAVRTEFDPTGRFHGLLGIAVLGGYRVVLDLPGGQLRLSQSGGASDGEPYWWVSGQLLVRAGSNPEAEGLFVLDTGAPISTAGVVAGQDGSPAALRGEGGAIPGSTLLRRGRVAFQGLDTGAGGIVGQDLRASSRLGGVEVGGTVGLDILSGAILDLDTRTQRVRVRSAPGKGGTGGGSRTHTPVKGGGF